MYKINIITLVCFLTFTTCKAASPESRDSLINNSISMFLDYEVRGRLACVYMNEILAYKTGFPIGFEFSKSLVDKYNITFLSSKKFKKHRRIQHLLKGLPVMNIWYCYSSKVGLCKVQVRFDSTKLKHRTFYFERCCSWIYTYELVNGKWILTYQGEYCI